MATVRAIADAVVDMGVEHPDPTAVKSGRSYDENDPIVERFPELFAFDNVEEAVSRPGERRNTRRPLSV